MKAITLATLLVFPALCLAQTEKRYGGHGYFAVAPGVTSPGGEGTLHFAFGGEGSFYKGLGVGLELGALGPTRSLSSSIGVFSANGYYSFLEPLATRKLVPFATGGYSLLFRGDRLNGVNFGGGVNYWFREHVGLRFEVRDHIPTQCGNVHFIDFRFGVAFR